MLLLIVTKEITRSSGKDDSPVLINQRLPFQMMPDRTGKNHFFQITPLAHQVLNRIGMTNLNNILGYNRPTIKICGYIVTGCPDNFYPLARRLSGMAWLREKREERSGEY